MEDKELELSDLENINGGLIVQGESWEGFWVVEPKTGKVLAKKYHFGDAVDSARANDVSTTVINKENYKKYYGRDIGS